MEAKFGLEYHGTRLAFVNLMDAYQDGGRLAEAYSLCKRWADGGSDLGHLRLGLLHYLGQGVAKDPAQALKHFRLAAELGNPAGSVAVGTLYERGEGVARDLGEADKWFEKAAEGTSLETLDQIAWILSTDRRPALRNGARAVVLAERAAAATSRKHPQFLGTLAAAYAEAGRFDQAVAVQKEAMALVKDETSHQDYEARLKLYEAHKPYREPE